MQTNFGFSFIALLAINFSRLNLKLFRLLRAEVALFPNKNFLIWEDRAKLRADNWGQSGCCETVEAGCELLQQTVKSVIWGNYLLLCGYDSNQHLTHL